MQMDSGHTHIHPSCRQVWLLQTLSPSIFGCIYSQGPYYLTSFDMQEETWAHNYAIWRAVSALKTIPVMEHCPNPGYHGLWLPLDCVRNGSRPSSQWPCRRKHFGEHKVGLTPGRQGCFALPANPHTWHRTQSSQPLSTPGGTFQ
jgi:hypothetical protein